MERFYGHKRLIYVISCFACLCLLYVAIYLFLSSITLSQMHAVNQTSHEDHFIMDLLWLELPIILMIGTVLFSPLFFLLYKWNETYKQFQHQKLIESFTRLLDQEPPCDHEWYPELMELQSWMERFQKDQERLHSYLSHEQKNIIMLLQTQCATIQDDKLHQTIEKLKHSIDDVLTLFVHQDQEQECMDLAMLCAEQCDAYRKLGLDLTFQFDEMQDYMIMGRTYWLERALANLLDNAIKYGNHKPVQLSLSKHEHTITCKIKDQGIGMAQDQLDHIFDYRYRIQNLQKNGEGIGLSLVAHVMKLCHGTVFVESHIGKGSCFYLSFPEAEVLT